MGGRALALGRARLDAGTVYGDCWGQRHGQLIWATNQGWATSRRRGQAGRGLVVVNASDECDAADAAGACGRMRPGMQTDQLERLRDESQSGAIEVGRGRDRFGGDLTTLHPDRQPERLVRRGRRARRRRRRLVGRSYLVHSVRRDVLASTSECWGAAGFSFHAPATGYQPLRFPYFTIQ